MELATLTTAEVMDSRDIAKLTGKEHGHVCRDIAKMLEEMELDQSSFGSVYRAGNGEDRKCFLLPKRESLIHRGPQRPDGRRRSEATTWLTD